MFVILQFLWEWAQSPDFSSLEWMVTLSCVSIRLWMWQKAFCRYWFMVKYVKCVKSTCEEKTEFLKCLLRPHYALNMCISILHPCCAGLIIREKGHIPANISMGSLVFNQAHFKLGTFLKICCIVDIQLCELFWFKYDFTYFFLD